jgi:hypothetical protein
MTSPLLAVRDLLLRLFQPDELRMFLHLRVDPQIDRCLPAEGASSELLAYRAAVALEQRGHLGPDFFAILARERPRRAPEIRDVARRVTDHHVAPGHLPAPDQSPRLIAIADKLEVFLRDFASVDSAAARWSDGVILVQEQLRELREILHLPAAHELARGALTRCDDDASPLRPKSCTPWQQQRALAEVARAAQYARVCAALLA